MSMVVFQLRVFLNSYQMESDDEIFHLIFKNVNFMECNFSLFDHIELHYLMIVVRNFELKSSKNIFTEDMYNYLYSLGDFVCEIIKGKMYFFKEIRSNCC